MKYRTSQVQGMPTIEGPPLTRKLITSFLTFFDNITYFWVKKAFLKPKVGASFHFFLNLR